MVRRDEIRAVLEEKGPVLKEQRRAVKNLGGKCTAAVKEEERAETSKAGGRRAGRGELTWHGGSESDSRPHLLPQMEQ